MDTYKIKFGFWKINVSPLKEKEINKIIYIVSQSRHCQDISFEQFGNMYFDEENDPNHWNPLVNTQDAFNRRNTTCAIFDVHPQNGFDQFNKMFLYKTHGSRINNYGIVMYNTKTGESSHQYFIYDDLYDIILHINKILNRLDRKESTDWTKAFKPSKYEKKTEYLNPITGMLQVNDWCVRTYPELPLVAGKNNSVYRMDKTNAF